MPAELLIVRVAAEVVTVLHVLLNTALYLLPSYEALAVKLSVVEVAPSMLFQSDPLLVLSCHCTVGDGVPLAAALNVTVPPEQADRFDGLAVTPGAVLTVRVAADVGSLPQSVVKTARYRLPF